MLDDRGSEQAERSAPEFPGHSPNDEERHEQGVHLSQRALAKYSPSARIKLRSQRLSRIMKQRGENQNDSFLRRQRRPFIKLNDLMADHSGVRPDVAFGMPFGILCAFRHRSTPWLAFRPCDDLVE